MINKGYNFNYLFIEAIRIFYYIFYTFPYYYILDEDPSKINLFVMVFETWECNSDINSCISIIVFDMNQWYKAQMPHQCYVGYSLYHLLILCYWNECLNGKHLF